MLIRSHGVYLPKSFTGLFSFIGGGRVGQQISFRARFVLVHGEGVGELDKLNFRSLVHSFTGGVGWILRLFSLYFPDLKIQFYFTNSCTFILSKNATSLLTGFYKQDDNSGQ